MESSNAGNGQDAPKAPPPLSRVTRNGLAKLPSLPSLSKARLGLQKEPTLSGKQVQLCPLFVFVLPPGLNVND